jgi:hypothetical protein
MAVCYLSDDKFPKDKTAGLTIFTVPFENATLDSEGGYIAPNATDLSLNSVEGNVTSLHNVPGYRLSADCKPTTMTKNSILLSYAETGYVKLLMSSNITQEAASELNLTDATTPTFMTYEWAGNPKDYFFDIAMEMNFPAFGNFEFAVNLIHLSGSLNNPDTSNKSITWRTIPTAWGDLLPTYQNITIQSTGTVTAYGTDSYALQCVLLRQDGLLEYRRRDDQTWFLAGSSFKDEKKAVRSFLEDWELSLSGDRSAPPLGDVLWGGATSLSVCSGGIGAECYGYRDFNTAVNNLVYASGEATRIIYNVAALNASRDNVDYFYNVTGEVDREFYRITYVPVLLLVALLGIIISALLVTVLVIATMKTWSWKSFRQVDITRLVVDSIGADLAKDDATTFARLRRASDDELAEWAASYRIGYEKVLGVHDVNGDGQPSVRLRHFTGGHMDKSGSYEIVGTAK